MYKMKRILIISVALTVCLGAHAQKKGGFMNALKKGVESSTGLNVSKEALFVYPSTAVGPWKMSVVSCVGDPESGGVELKVNVTAMFSSPRLTGAWAIITKAKSADGTEFGLARRSADPLYDLVPNTPVEVTFQHILGVPADTKTLNVTFYVEHNTPAYTFELRDCPIEWVVSE